MGNVAVTLSAASISSSALNAIESISTSENYTTGTRSEAALTFTVPDNVNGGDNVKIMLTLTAGSGITGSTSFIIDDVMLTKAVGPTDHSYVSYGSFDATGINSSATAIEAISDVWQTESGAAPTVSTATDIFGSSVKVTANGASSESYVKQRVFPVQEN